MGTRLEISQGQLEGTRVGAQTVFRGIPFAAPPIGTRRWAPPAPPEPWSGVRQAGEFSAAAPQIDPMRIANVRPNCAISNSPSPFLRF